MDLVSTVRKSGSRGGVNFSWDEVANSNHRENYLGHSLMAPVGRWQKGKDLGWYAKGDDAPANPDETDAERQERERKEEMRRVKEAEEDAMAKALGLPPPVRNTSGANAIEVPGESSRTGAEAPAAEAAEMKRGRSRRHGESERREKRRHRSRSPSRGYDDRKPRRRHRERSREGEDRRHVREQARSERRDRHRRDKSRDRRRSRSGDRRRRSPGSRERRY